MYQCIVIRYNVVLSCGTELEPCNLQLAYLVRHVIVNDCFAISKYVKVRFW